MTVTAEAEQPSHLEGTYAGVATRTAAFVIDVLTVTVTFAIGSAVVERIVALFLGRTVVISDNQLASTIALGAWWFLYVAYPLATSGRTFGMAIVGLRAVRADGSDLGAGAAVVRTIVFPLSFLLVGLGFALIVLRRDHRALHDLIAGSTVVYAWKARAARLRFLAPSP